MNWNKYLNGFTIISGLLTSIGVIIPAFSYWGLYYPPLIKASALITAIAGFVVIVIYFYRTPEDTSATERLPPLIKQAVVALFLSVVLLIGYLALFDICTVADPTGQELYQIGFGKSEWGLTDEGKRVKAKYPNSTAQDWMTDGALFKSDGPKVIWTTWSIVLFGIILTIFFLGAFVLWTLGWALIAKQFAANNDESS